MPTNWELLHLCLHPLKNWLTKRKGLFNSTFQFVAYPGSIRVQESYKHWHHILHFIIKVAMVTSMIVIINDWLRKHRSKGQKVLSTWYRLFPTNKKTEIKKAVCLFCNNKDYKDKLITVGEYHSVSNNPNTKHMESITENWKQMAVQLGEFETSDSWS